MIFLSFDSTTNPQPVPQKLQIVFVVCKDVSILNFQTISSFSKRGNKLPRQETKKVILRNHADQ